MIDLHSHILYGLDDGPEAIEGSLEIAREAAEAGVGTIVATPHVREDYPTEPRAMEKKLKKVRSAIEAAGIDINVLSGAEIAFDRLPDLTLDDLDRFRLGGDSAYLLVELPFFGWPLDASDWIEHLADEGFRAVLAHPERNSVVQGTPGRLEELLALGALVQVTASSFVGSFGPAAQESAHTLLRNGMAHLIASDTHRARSRRSAVTPALAALDDESMVHWLTVDMPHAVLSGTVLPAPPKRSQQRGGRSLLRRRR